jgi:phospholipid/cholesterol/gamma-HCH transport system substrate-binding protein
VSTGKPTSMTGLIVRLVAFVAVSGLLSTVVVASLLNLDLVSSHSYHALFTDASDLQSGDPVRIAGVQVGRVQAVQLRPGNRAEVTFKVNADQPVTQATQVDVEFENLFGEHNLSLSQQGSGAPLRPGSTIPITRTKPALDLSDLFNGFEPLFQALTPNDVNQLTANIIGTFQGQSGSLAALVSQAGALTNNLADHQQVIDSVVDNLTQLLQVVADHDGEVGQLIDNFDSLAQAVSGERAQLSSALGNANNLLTSLATEMGNLQSPFEAVVQSLTSVAGAVDANQAQINAAVNVLPSTLTQAAKTVQNGAFINTYYCSLGITIPTPVPLLVDPGQTIADTVLNATGLNLPYLGGVRAPSGVEGDPNAHTPNCQP